MPFSFQSVTLRQQTRDSVGLFHCRCYLNSSAATKITVSNVNNQSRAELLFLYHIHIYSPTGVKGDGFVSQTKINSTKKYFRPITVTLLNVIFSAHLQIQSTLNLFDITSKSRHVCNCRFTKNVSNIIRSYVHYLPQHKISRV